MLGGELLEIAKSKDVFLRQEDGTYKAIDKKVIPFMAYHAQILPKAEKANFKSSDPFARYNKKVHQVLHLSTHDGIFRTLKRTLSRSLATDLKRSVRALRAGTCFMSDRKRWI